MKICSELCTGRCYSNKASQKKPPLLTASTKGSACAAEEGTGCHLGLPGPQATQEEPGPHQSCSPAVSELRVPELLQKVESV